MKLEDVQKLEHGAYILYWEDGGFSLATVGSLYNGDRWFAPTNWTATQAQGVASTQWEKVERAALLVRRVTGGFAICHTVLVAAQPDAVLE